MTKEQYIVLYGFAPLPSDIDITPIQPDANYHNHVVGSLERLVFGIEIKNKGVNSLLKYSFRGGHGELLPGNSKVFTTDHPRYYMGIDLTLKFEDCDLGDTDKDGNVVAYPAGVVYEATILEEFIINNLNC